MSSIVIAGDTSGSVTLQAPAVSGSTILTLPATSGTVQTSGAGFTTNGVAYASSTSALTTGSAFKFDGANIIVNATTPAYFTGTSNLAQISINRSPSTGAIFNASQSAAFVNIDGDSGGSSFQFATASAANTQPSEKMRLTGAGSLCVGSTSAGDAGTVTVSIGNPGTTAGGLQLWATSAQEHYIQYGDSTTGSATYAGAISYAHATNFMRFWTGSTERARIDSSGNLLVGSTSTAGTNAPTAITVAGRLRSVAAGTSTIANGATVDIALTMPRTIVSYYIVSDGNSNNMSAGFFRANDNGASSNYTLFSQSEANVAVTSPSAGIIRITNNTGGSSAFNYAFTVLSGT